MVNQCSAWDFQQIRKEIVGTSLRIYVYQKGRAALDRIELDGLISKPFFM